MKCNVIFRELTPAEIHDLLKEEVEGNKFTKLFTTFLQHYKSNMYEFDKIEQKSIETKSERTRLFIKLFKFIFAKYEEFQDRNNCIDFDDMIVKALNLIESGKYTHQFKHIFIDEFQDISTTRMLLIRKLLPINNTSMTVVGDDWQSINAFAGSNIKIIQDFTKIFSFSQTIKLDYTFRFDNIISYIASDFIQKNPHQINKEIKTIKEQVTKFSILLYWSTGDTKSDLIKIIDLIDKKENNAKILVLARYKILFDELRGIFKSKYPNFDIKFSTVHSSKGNEADYVIVLNLDKGKFGFPSKIEDDPILNLVIPEGDEFEDAEERRLFYVAITRTKKNVFLLSNTYEKSTFIEEIIENYQDDIFFLNDPKIKLINCPECKTGLLKKKNKQGKNIDKPFYGCNNFPRCEYTENVQYCPKCNGEVFRTEGNKNAKCSNDTCDFETTLCIKCGGYMIEKDGKYGKFLGCTNYPKCSHTLQCPLKS